MALFDKTPYKFAIGQKVTHFKTGGVYVIVSYSIREEDLIGSYNYQKEDGTGPVFNRIYTVMEYAFS